MLAFSDSVVFLVVCCCFNIYIQQTNTADPSQEKRDLSDSSSGKWKNDKPVKKTEESLCLSYNGSDKQRKLCTVVINNQSIASDVDQEGSFRVYQNEELCILCMHNLHFANDSINKNIHLEYGLHRIVSTTLKDILEKGLVDYEIIVKNDQEAEIYIMNYGLQAKCTSKPMVNKTVMTTKLIFKDGEIVKLHQTQILYNRCSSFDISCSFGSMDYPLDIPTYCAKDNCENNGEGKSTGTIVGVVVGLLVLLIITLVIVLVLIKKRKDDKGGYLAAIDMIEK